MNLNRDDHERTIFLQALNLPGDPDQRHPFDAERFLEGFTEEPERIIHRWCDRWLGCRR